MFARHANRSYLAWEHKKESNYGITLDLTIYDSEMVDIPDGAPDHRRSDPVSDLTTNSDL